MERAPSPPLALRRPKRRAAEAISPVKANSSSLNVAAATPIRQRSSKRVRFSTGMLPNNSASIATLPGTTGLTPAVGKAKLSTPKRRSSTPAVRNRVVSLPTITSSSPPPTINGEVQITPIRQTLDDRMRRRIRRNHLSEEVNSYEQDKREMSKLRKQIDDKDAELKKLRQELEVAKVQQKENPRSDLVSEQGEDSGFVLTDEIAASEKVNEIEEELSLLRRSFDDFNSRPISGEVEADWNGIPRGMGSGPHSEGGDTIRIYEDETDYYSMKDAQDAQDAAVMGAELESARQAKQTLLSSFSRNNHRLSFDPNELRFADSPARPTIQTSSQEPSLPSSMKQAISKQLRQATSRAEDAELALEALEGEVRALCATFAPDQAASAGLTALGDHFRSIRLELEHLMPGESAVGLNNNAALFPDLVSKLKSLLQNLGEQEGELRSLRSQEKNLRGNFDHTLQALEKANSKIKKLEEEVDQMAEEMLGMRVRSSRLEKERDEAHQDNKKLKDSLMIYRGEVKRLEDLIHTMEAEHVVALRDAQSSSGDLEAKVASEETGRRKAEESAVSRLRKIQELEEKLTEAHERAAAVEMEMRQTLEAQQSRHDDEVGGLHARISNLANAQTSAEEEIKRLRKVITKSQQKYEEEVYRGGEAAKRMREEVIKAATRIAETAKGYRRASRVSLANWQMESDDLLMDETGAPMTPNSVVRFSDFSEVQDLGEEDGGDVSEGGDTRYESEDDQHVPGSVEMSRGKKKSMTLTPELSIANKRKPKRRYDSGIGISDMSEAESDVDDSGIATPELSSEADFELNEVERMEMAC